MRIHAYRIIYDQIDEILLFFFTFIQELENRTSSMKMNVVLMEMKA